MNKKNNLCERCSHKVISEWEKQGMPSLVAALAHIGLDCVNEGPIGYCEGCGETTELIAEGTDEECQSIKPS